MPKAKCPKSSDHKRFITVAHISQDWEVDENGHWLNTIEDLETVHGPDSGNTWQCAVCGEEAEVTN
jgi:hypothetical protein